jgi:hypothetical protein
LVKEILNAKFKTTQGIINYLGCNTATDAGVYTFKLKDCADAKEVQARYTFQ